MTGDFKNIIKVASIYVATIIGAGFASGQEIMQFFSGYYKGGFYGIIFAGILFSLIGMIVLNKVYKYRIRNYDEFLFPAVGWFIGWIMEIVITLFMLTLFCIMLAGQGNIIESKLGIPFNYGIIAAAAVCLIIILSDVKGIVVLSTFVTPVLIGGILVIGLYIIASNDTYVFNMTGYFKQLTRNWFFSSLLYVSYNSIMSIVIMCSLLPYLKSKKVGIVGGMLGGIFLMLVALVLNTAIFLFFPDRISGELPVLSIVEKYSGVVSGFYSFILWLAMLISAVTSGYCMVDRVCSKMKRANPKLIAMIFCGIAIPLSTFGFSTLIASLYPLFGYIGMFMVFVVLFQGARAVPELISARKHRRLSKTRV